MLDAALDAVAAAAAAAVLAKSFAMVAGMPGRAAVFGVVAPLPDAAGTVCGTGAWTVREPSAGVAAGAGVGTAGGGSDGVNGGVVAGTGGAVEDAFDWKELLKEVAELPKLAVDEPD